MSPPRFSAASNYAATSGSPLPSRETLITHNTVEGLEAEWAKATGGTYICVAIRGYGADHDRTLADYQRIAATNKHVRVVSFDSETGPNVLAKGLISLLG